MKKSLIVGVAAFVLAAVSMGVAQAQKASSARKSVIYVAADKATFKESPGTTGVSMAALWGPGQRASRDIHEVHAGVRRGNAYSYERSVDRGYQRRLSL
jgi:hypothetical protein